MDEADFTRLLDLFPIVRSRNYCAVSCEAINGSTSSLAQQEINEWNNAWNELDNDCKSNCQDQFWSNLKSAAERQEMDIEKLRVILQGSGRVTEEEAKSFCNAFHRIYKKLVNEELSIETARKFVVTGQRLTG